MRKNQIAIAAFTLVFIGIIIYHAGFFSKKKAPIKRVQRPQASAPESAQFVTLNRKPFDEGWGRNPFFLPGEQAARNDEPEPLPIKPKAAVQTDEKLSPLKLEMIFDVNGQKGAILSGRTVKEGDPIGAEIVTKIGSDRVVLEKNGQKRTIKLDLFPNPFSIQGER